MPVKGMSKNKIMKKEIKKFKEGKLHIGKSKKIVKSRAQAIAIGLSESGQSKTK